MAEGSQSRLPEHQLFPHPEGRGRPYRSHQHGKRRHETLRGRHEGPVSEPHQHDVPHAEPGRRGRLPDDAHAGFRREGRQQQQT